MKKIATKSKFFKKSFSTLKLVVVGSFLVIALALVVNSAQRSQDNRSSAATPPSPVTYVSPNDKKCKDAGGRCQKIDGPCDAIEGYGGYLSGLCPSYDNTVKCCIDPDFDKIKEAEKIAVKQDSKCAKSGGVCQSKKGGCSSGKWVDGGCPSSDSDKIGCCIETHCNSTECKCQTTEACRAVGCSYTGGKSSCYKYVAPTAKPTSKPTGKTNRSACTKNSECTSGKCAITDSSKTRVCIPATGTVYVCDYYYSDSYSEKWVNGKQEGKGKKCKSSCNILTGYCK